jgi:hypothetical protein
MCDTCRIKFDINIIVSKLTEHSSVALIAKVDLTSNHLQPNESNNKQSNFEDGGNVTTSREPVNYEAN